MKKPIHHKSKRQLLNEQQLNLNKEEPKEKMSLEGYVLICIMIIAFAATAWSIIY